MRRISVTQDEVIQYFHSFLVGQARWLVDLVLRRLVLPVAADGMRRNIHVARKDAAGALRQELAQVRPVTQGMVLATLRVGIHE